jgi:hypothetical protein
MSQMHSIRRARHAVALALIAAARRLAGCEKRAAPA